MPTPLNVRYTQMPRPEHSPLQAKNSSRGSRASEKIGAVL